jgi:hypothetical protein
MDKQNDLSAQDKKHHFNVSSYTRKDHERALAEVEKIIKQLTFPIFKKNE